MSGSGGPDRAHATLGSAALDECVRVLGREDLDVTGLEVTIVAVGADDLADVGKDLDDCLVTDVTTHG
jgi:hypothetical protein